ncbi:MAG: ImmA/IrrE family metallo-endopeptidase [Acidiferrobacterales bacterium]
MSFDKKILTREAVARALQTRRMAGYAVWDPVCVYDLAEKIGVEVRFVDIPSMEGMYSGGGTPAIIISSLRPSGRQAFTASHELGHHVFGHGAQYDELVEKRSEKRRFDPKEFQADSFAGALLMPKSAVDRGFSLRGWGPATCSPEAFYTVATWLGVGYSTLVYHMQYAMQVITSQRADELLRQQLIVTRSNLVDKECREHLVVADRYWTGRAIDIQVSDLVLLPSQARIEGNCAVVCTVNKMNALAQGITPGIGRVVVDNLAWSAFIRVTRKQFSGRGKYRFEEEVNDVE